MVDSHIRYEYVSRQSDIMNPISGECMFCPECGADNQKQNSYCTRCGGWLPDIRTLLRGDSRIDVIGGRTPEQKLNGIVKNNAVGALLTLFSAVAILISLDSIGGSLILFVLFACIISVALQTISFLVGRKMQQEVRRIRAGVDQAAELRGGHGATALEDAKKFTSAQTVTEDTTRTLEPANKKRDTS